MSARTHAHTHTHAIIHADRHLCCHTQTESHSKHNMLNQEVGIQGLVDTNMASCATSAPQRKYELLKLVTFFWLTLPNLRKEIAMRGKKKLHFFYEEPFSQTMNFETLIDWKSVNFVFSVKRRAVGCFFHIFFFCERSHKLRLIHCQKSKNLPVFMQRRSTHSVWWGFCAFCKSVGLFSSM